MNLSFKQVEIAKSLFEIEDAKFLDEIQAMIQNYRKTKTDENAISKFVDTKKEVIDEELEALHELAKQPTPEHIPLEVLIKEQNFTNEAFSEALESVDDTLFEDESLEEMLNTLTK